LIILFTIANVVVFGYVSTNNAQIVMYQPTIVNISDVSSLTTFNISADPSLRSVGYYTDHCGGPAVVATMLAYVDHGSLSSSSLVFDYVGKSIFDLWTTLGTNLTIISPLVLSFQSVAYDSNGMRIIPTALTNTKLLVYVGDQTDPRPASMFPSFTETSKRLTSDCSLIWEFTPPFPQFRNASYFVYYSTDIFNAMISVCSIESGTFLGSLSVNSTLDTKAALSTIRIYSVSTGITIGLFLRTADGRSQRVGNYVVPAATCAPNYKASLTPSITPQTPTCDTSSNRDHVAVIVLSVFLSLAMVALCIVARKQRKSSHQSDAFVHLTSDVRYGATRDPQ